MTRPSRYPPPYGGLPRYPSPERAGGRYSPEIPSPRGNGFAVAGIILAFLFWPLGLTLAIVGLAKSGARAGAGRVLSIVAIVVAALVGAASVSVAAVVAIDKPTVADPGCVSAESAFRAMHSTLSSDDAAIARDQNNRAAAIADINRLAADDQTLVTQLNAAKAEAAAQSVKNKIGTMSSDLSGMLAAIKGAENGGASQLSMLDTYQSRIKGDGSAIDEACSVWG